MKFSKILLCIGFVYPEPKSSAAGTRMLQLLKSFLDQGYKITFGTTAKLSDHALDLTKLGIRVEALDLNSNTFDNFLVKLNPSVVLFDRFMTEEQFGWRVAEHCPDALRILDTEDLHFLRKSREHHLKTKLNFSKSFINSNIAKREIASLFRCDLSLIISEFELDILINHFRIDPSLLQYIPLFFESTFDTLKLPPPTYVERQHFIFIGNFLHAPNANTVEFLKFKIWPLLSKALPEAELHIYGAYAKPKHLSLTDSSNNFFVHGFVDDAFAAICSARVMLAPIQFGAGLKGKILDALHCGTPCVMSSIAAEGIFGDHLPNGFVEDRIENYVDKAIQLYTNSQVWETSKDNGFKVLKNRFNSEPFLKQLFEKINDLSLNLESHRLQNFTGMLLQHHSMQSTKYLSKWIEAKNKIN